MSLASTVPHFAAINELITDVPIGSKKKQKECLKLSAEIMTSWRKEGALIVASV